MGKAVELPAWAAKIAPLDMDSAAVVLGISRRTLVDVVKNHPHYERRGVRKVFYPEHIDALKFVIDRVPPTTPLEVLVEAACAGLDASRMLEMRSYLTKPATGSVYLVECNDRVKIGFTTHFARRFRVLKTACPYPTRLIAVIPGDRDIELFLHRAFAAQRRHGEWFEVAGQLQDLIAALEGLAE